MNGRIGIVGGSIAGCAAALAASRAGCDVMVFERSSSLRERGLGVGMSLATYQDLLAWRYLDPGLPVHRVAHRLWILAEPGEPTGRVLWRQPTPALAVNWGQLWRVLADRVTSSYRAGEQVVSVAADGSIITADGTRRSFDLVIGADGHQSQVRSVISPDHHPREAGYVLWRGAVTEQNLPPWLTAMLESAFVTVVFSGGHGIFYLIPSSSGARLLTWGVYTQPQQPGHLGTSEVWETLERFLPPAWADVCRPSEFIGLHPVTDLTADAYVAHPFVLIGDAATLARPHAASGAVKAMLDAACLERSLIAGADWNEVLARYDAERRPEGNRLVDIGRRIGHAMVERTPEWASMTPADMSSWTAALLGGHDHYLYRPKTQEMTS